jgi:hypothetical protein
VPNNQRAFVGGIGVTLLCIAIGVLIAGHAGLWTEPVAVLGVIATGAGLILKERPPTGPRSSNGAAPNGPRPR